MERLLRLFMLFLFNKKFEARRDEKVLAKYPAQKGFDLLMTMLVPNSQDMRSSESEFLYQKT